MKIFTVGELPLYEAEPPFTRLNKVIIDEVSCGTRNVSVGLGIYRRGEKAEMHQHPNSEEIMYFKGGRGRITLESGEAFEVGPDTVTYVPPGEKHKIENIGDEPLVFIFIYVPAGPEKAIRQWKIVEERS